MSFVTDKQTVDDLNMLGAPGGDSVYSLFNRCSTRGGAALLEEMFRYPLSDPGSINERSETIRFFARQKVSFPFTIAHFSPIETYLSNNDARSKLTAAASLRSRIQQLVAKDIDTAAIYKGIQAAVSLLAEINSFMDGLSVAPELPYRKEYDAIHHLLHGTQLKEALTVSGQSMDQLYVPLDALFRFSHRAIFLTLLQYLYRLDVYLSVASVAVEKQFCFPEALPSANTELNVQGFYHPLIKKGIGNSIHVTPDNNVIFLTGANMAGKSTLMKALSIAVMLAHAGLPVPAEAMRFSVLDGVYTTINLPDNLGIGASHFFAEVLRIKKIALELAAGKQLFVVFDELFRGTNVKDAFEATLAITKGFARWSDSIFMISTHIIETAPVLKAQCNNILFVYLPTQMQDMKPTYTYRLEQGVTNDRHGMLIIKNEHILQTLEKGKMKRLI